MYKNNVVLSDNDSDKIMLGGEWNNGDWNLRLATRILYLEDMLTEDELKDSGKYEVSILAVSPEAAGKENLESAYNFASRDYKKDQNDLIDYLFLIEYGVYATLWHESGNNLKALLKNAHNELQSIHPLFGFYMDREQNRVGNDGWDFISGNIGLKKQIDD